MTAFGTIFSRYVFRQSAGTLLLILLSLCGVVWIALALRQLNLVTTQGQETWIFIKMTLLALPNLMALVAPLALLVAVIHVLNRLNGDSELIVATAAGATIWNAARPLLVLALLVSMAVTFVIVVAVWRSLAQPGVVHDERAYLLQAEIFSHGRWTAAAPPLADFFEATARLELRPRPVQTPLAECVGREIAPVIGLFPILRAGLGMAEAILDLLPTAHVWHLGLYRDHQTMQPVTYYNKLPTEAKTDLSIVLDPMLATGGSAVAAVACLKRWGARRIQYLGLIAAPEGVRALQTAHAEVPVFLAAVDAGFMGHEFGDTVLVWGEPVVAESRRWPVTDAARYGTMHA